MVFVCVFQEQSYRELQEEIWDTIDQWHQECTTAMHMSVTPRPQPHTPPPCPQPQGHGHTAPKDKVHVSKKHDNSSTRQPHQDHTPPTFAKSETAMVHHTPANNILDLIMSCDNAHQGINNNNETMTTDSLHSIMTNELSVNDNGPEQKHVTSLTISSLQGGRPRGVRSSNKRERGEGCERILNWENLGSPDETRSWSRSSRSDMMKSYTPRTITKELKGVTTTEEIV